MRQIENDTNRMDYLAGYDSKIEEIRGMGWDAARDKFNLDYPHGWKPKNNGAYYYASGEIDALADEM